MRKLNLRGPRIEGSLRNRVQEVMSRFNIVDCFKVERVDVEVDPERYCCSRRR